MKSFFIQKQNAPRLTLFFAGWGMDAHPFADLRPEGSDLLLCYDYRSLDFDGKLLMPYREIRVAGWSMGVWAASHVLSSAAYPVTESIAVNGTPYPVDDARGIPEAIFRGTLEGLSERNLQKFYRRMCLPGAGLAAFLEKRPHRPLAELAEELRRIGEQAFAAPAPRYAWSQAVIGKKDLIFLPAHQAAAWEEAGVPWTEADIPHYADEALRACLAFPLEK